MSSLNITRTSSKVEWQIFWLPLRAFCVSVRIRPASSRIWTLELTVDCGRSSALAMSLTLSASVDVEELQDAHADGRGEALEDLDSVLGVDDQEVPAH